MASTARRHAAHRAVRDISEKAVKGMERRERVASAMGFFEVEQQFQIQVSGDATSTVGYSEVELDFDYRFAYAPGNRDSDLPRPQLSVAGEVETGVGFFVGSVKEWKVDEENGTVTGCTLYLGVIGEGAYAGYAHVTFQGYGTTLEDEASV